MALNDLQRLINTIKLEDTTILLALIDEINTKKLEGNQITDLFRGLSATKVTSFTVSQLELLQSMHFRGGYRVHIYSYNTPPSPYETAVKHISRSWSLFSSVSTLPKEDLKYLSEYHRTKWRKGNPSRTNAKGTQLTFKMDMFSLQMFKNSIKKGFLRTEAKNFVIKVNAAYNETTRTTAATKIRNKFYALILDNTEVHTKTMINNLQMTHLALSDGTYYPADEDEALVVSLGYAGNPLAVFNTVDSMNSYSTDLNIVTHNNGSEDTREGLRLISAASVLLAIHAKTNNQSYAALAARMLVNTQSTIKADVLQRTAAIEQLRNTLKDTE